MTDHELHIEDNTASRNPVDVEARFTDGEVADLTTSGDRYTATWSVDGDTATLRSFDVNGKTAFKPGRISDHLAALRDTDLFDTVTVEGLDI